MNAVEIEEAISRLADQPFDPENFPFAFLEAFGNKETTIKRLRAGASNKSDLGGVLQTNNIHVATCDAGQVTKTLAALKESQKGGMIPVEIEIPDWPYDSLNIILFAEAAASFEDVTLSRAVDHPPEQTFHSLRTSHWCASCDQKDPQIHRNLNRLPSCFGALIRPVVSKISPTQGC